MKLEEIESALRSSDAEERRRAASELCAFGGALPPGHLLRALGDEDWRVRKEAAQAAVAVAPSAPVLDALVSALEPGDNVGLRNAAVHALAGFGVHAIGPLASAARRLDADGRKLVVDALAAGGRPEALSVLEALLEDPERNVRVAAVEAIAAIGDACAEQAIALLDSCLDSGDSLQKLAALDGLNRLTAVLPWQRLEGQLDDPVLLPAVVVAAGRAGEPAAVPIMVRLLEQARGRMFQDVLESLVLLVRTSDLARARALELLRGVSADVRDRVLAMARREDEPLQNRRLALTVAGLFGGTEAAALAIEALDDDDIAADAEAALMELGSIAVGGLVLACRSPSVRQRARAVELLAPMVALDSDARAATWTALSDESPQVVAAALEALAAAADGETLVAAAGLMVPGAAPLVHDAAHNAVLSIARHHPDRAKELARRIAPGSPEAAAAVAVIEALGSPVRESVARDIEFLTNALGSEHTSVRRGALAALSAVGGREAVQPITLALTDEEAEVRLAAVRALGRARDGDGLEIGLEALSALIERGDDQELRAAAARALGELCDERVLPLLREAVRAEPRVAVAALESLVGSRPEIRAEIALHALAHPDAEVVKSALRALAGDGVPEVELYVANTLEHASRDVRRLAAELLGRLAAPAALGALRGRLAVEEEPLVKEAVARAILEIESGAGRRMTAPPPSLDLGQPHR